MHECNRYINVTDNKIRHMSVTDNNATDNSVTEGAALIRFPESLILSLTFRGSEGNVEQIVRELLSCVPSHSHMCNVFFC